MTTSNEKSYFDLHITGLGCLNRIREVKPKKGISSWPATSQRSMVPAMTSRMLRFDARAYRDLKRSTWCAVASRPSMQRRR